MKAFLVFAFILFILFSPGTTAQEKQVFSPGDFAGAIELKGNSGSLLSLTIPETVYRGLQRPDLGDLRIYDSAGNPAPFLIRSVPGITETLPEQTVPVLAWNENTNRFSAHGIEINTSEIAVTITGQNRYEKDSVYLVDLSGLEINPSRLILNFNKNELFNAALSIRYSSDLVQWNDYDKIQTAAFYNNPGTDKNEFDIPRGSYLLLNFDGKIPAIESCIVRFDPAEIPILQETSFNGIKSDDGKIIRYTTGGCFPVVKIRFVLLNPDSIRVIIRETKDAPYSENTGRARSEETTIYRIQAPGKEPSMNGAVNMPGLTGPYWEIEALGEQFFTESPVMSVIWETRELIFLARGQGPWILAYGNKDCVPSISTLSVGEEDIFPAAIGKHQLVQKSTAGDSGFNWKHITLWGVLLLSAAALSSLAIYIIKSARNGEQDTKE